MVDEHAGDRLIQPGMHPEKALGRARQIWRLRVGLFGLYPDALDTAWDTARRLIGF